MLFKIRLFGSDQGRAIEDAVYSICDIRICEELHFAITQSRITEDSFEKLIAVEGYL